jgi:hypothetical protein
VNPGRACIIPAVEIKKHPDWLTGAFLAYIWQLKVQWQNFNQKDPLNQHPGPAKSDMQCAG